MMDSANNEETAEQGKANQRKTSLLKCGVVAILWALIGLAFGVYWYASPMLAILVVYGTYKLASYCRKRYQAHMLPPSFTARLRKAELYQIFVVRAVRRQGSHLLLWVAALSFACAWSFSENFFNPVLDLHEMAVETGFVEKAYRRQRHGTRKGCGDIVYLRTKNGKRIRYNGWLTDNDIKKILADKGTSQVTLWSQIKVGSPPCAKKNWINQIKVGDQIVHRYKKDRRIWRNNLAPKVVVISTILGCLSLAGVWLSDRRSKLINVEGDK